MKTNRPFIKLDYAIKEAKALTRTTIAVYEALLWFQRYHSDCFPGYEKLKTKAKVRSKTTLSLHLKVLIKVGLVKKTRRGKMQSNIYEACRAERLTDQILKNLSRSHKYILDEIKEDDEKRRKVKNVRRELKAKNMQNQRMQKVLKNQTYPHESEVQLVDSKKALRAFNIYSSNLNNDSKENKKEENRGGEFRSIREYIKASLKGVPKGAGSRLERKKQESHDKIHLPLLSSSKSLSMRVERSRINAVMDKVSQDIGDPRHVRENAMQAKNIFNVLKEKGIAEAGFIESLMQSAGVTKEIRGVLDRPGAYFFSLLRDKWKAYL